MGLVLGLASTPLNNEIFFCDMLFHIRAQFGDFGLFDCNCTQCGLDSFTYMLVIWILIDDLHVTL